MTESIKLKEEDLYCKNLITLIEADQLEELFSKRTSMCGVGTKRVKYYLNRRAKKGDRIAEVLYLALKAEDKRISSMMCSDRYRDRNENQAACILSDLFNLIDKSGIGDYGYLDFPYSDFKLGADVGFVCIDLPGCEQIGYVVPGRLKRRPYTRELNNPDKTNLAKIEEAVNRLYGEQIVSTYGSTVGTIEVKLPKVVIKRFGNYAGIFEPRSSSTHLMRIKDTISN